MTLYMKSITITKGDFYSDLDFNSDPNQLQIKFPYKTQILTDTFMITLTSLVCLVFSHFTVLKISVVDTL